MIEEEKAEEVLQRFRKLMINGIRCPRGLKCAYIYEVVKHRDDRKDFIRKHDSSAERAIKLYDDINKDVENAINERQKAFLALKFKDAFKASDEICEKEKEVVKQLKKDIVEKSSPINRKRKLLEKVFG